jgi:hypothetical protein
MRLSRLLLLAGLMLVTGVAAPAVRAQRIVPAPPGMARPDGSSLRISLITAGQGDRVYEMFGHNAIWIHDDATNTDSVFHWGVFDMRERGFIIRFLGMYTMADTDLASTMYQYRQANRPLWVQELDLTPAERVTVRDFIRWNAKPENRPYLYDYFRDNCSTRVRDVIDSALAGALRPQLEAKATGTTYRDHALRLMQRDFLLTTGVDIGLGRPTDKPISAWAESFLPTRLQAHLRDVKLDGGTRKLVKNELVLLPANRDPEPTILPPIGRSLLFIGLALGGLIAIFGTRFALAPRIVSAYLIGAWSILAGILGLALLYLWTASDHVAAYQNENLLLFHPLWFAALPIARAVKRADAPRLSRRALILLVAPAFVALAMHIVRLSRQDNLALIGLVMPIAVAIWVAARRPTAVFSK